MRSGICVAGVTSEPDPVSGLRWVRPVRDFDTVQPGDMSDEHEHLFQCGDVVMLRLLEPRPDPPHVEDWVTDFVYHRPRLLRHLKGQRRADFFGKYVDPAPHDVITHCRRSLCLIQPRNLCAHFSLDAYSAKYEARMSFELMESSQQGQPARKPWRTDARGIPVTDLKWRALGQSWLAGIGGQLALQDADICKRIEADALYLTIGLSRTWQGRCWPMVVGVHTVPDYEAPIDLSSAL
jgi:hypothetical protein